MKNGSDRKRYRSVESEENVKWRKSAHGIARSVKSAKMAKKRRNGNEIIWQPSMVIENR